DPVDAKALGIHLGLVGEEGQGGLGVLDPAIRVEAKGRSLALPPTLVIERERGEPTGGETPRHLVEIQVLDSGVSTAKYDAWTPVALGQVIRQVKVGREPVATAEEAYL